MANEKMPWELVTTDSQQIIQADQNGQPDEKMPWELVTTEQQPQQNQIQQNDGMWNILKYPAQFVSSVYKEAGNIADTFDLWTDKINEWQGGNWALHIGKKPEEGKSFFELGPYLQIMHYTAEQYKNKSAFDTIRETSYRLSDNLNGAIEDAGGVDKWTKAIISGSGQAAADIPAIMAMGLPVFSGMAGGAESIKYGDSILKGVVTGSIKGAALHTILKGLNMLPRLERVAAGSALFGGVLPKAEESLARVLGQEPSERDWPQVVADYIVGAGLSWAGPKGFEYRRQFYRDTFDYLTNGPERMALERSKRFVDVMQKRMDRELRKNRTPDKIIQDMINENLGQDFGINLEAVKDDIVSLAVKQGIKEGMDNELSKKQYRPEIGITPKESEAQARDFWDEKLEYNDLRTGFETNAGAVTAGALEAGGDILREVGKSNINDSFYIKEKIDRIEAAAKSRDWTDPLSANELMALDKIKAEIENIPEGTSEKVSLIKDLLNDIIDRKDPTSNLEKLRKINWDKLSPDKVPADLLTVDHDYAPGGIGSIVFDSDNRLIKAWAAEHSDATVNEAIEWLKEKAASENEKIATSDISGFEKEQNFEPDYVPVSESTPYSHIAKELQIFQKSKELEELKRGDVEKEVTSNINTIEDKLYGYAPEEMTIGQKAKMLLNSVKEVPPLLYKDPLTNRTIKISPRYLNTLDWIAQNEKRLERYQKYADGLSKIIDTIDDMRNTFSIEHQFRDAMNIGNSIKRSQSIQKMYEDWGIKTLKKIVKLVNYDDDFLSRMAFIYEDKLAPEWKDSRYRPALEELDKFFKDMYNELEQRGGITQTWNERMIDMLKEELKDPTLTKQQRNLIKRTIKRVRETNFEHIPSKIWFERGLQQREAANKFEHMRNLLSLGTVRERKTIRLIDLVNNGTISKESVHIRDVIGDYAKRIGKDISLLDVLREGEKIGWITDKPRRVRLRNGRRLEYKSAPYHAPIFRKKFVHPILSKWIWEISGDPSGSNLFSEGIQKTMSMIKMTQFYNPLILPMYDMVQLGMLDPAAVKQFGKAWKDFREQNEMWREAEYWGARSRPYANLMDDYLSQLSRASNKWTKNVFDAHNLLPNRMIKNMYTASWNTAWALDGVIRQATYRQLRAKGYTPREAGRLTAKFHGDYANIPTRTRKFLNHFMFTPTFKIAMGKLHKDMIKGVIQLGQGDKTSRYMSRKHAIGLARAIGAMIAWDILMTQFMGFKREDFGWKYSKEIVGEYGLEDIVIGMSGPHNMWNNEVHRIMDAVSPINDNPLKAWYNSQKNKEHPLFGIVSDIIENVDRNAEPKMFSTGKPVPIYKKFDDPYNQWLDRARYFVRNVFPIIKTPGNVTSVFGKKIDNKWISADERQLRVNEIIADETSKIFDLITRPITFRYSKTPKWVRAQKKLQQLDDDIKSQIKLFGPSGWEDKESPATRALLKKIDELQEIVNDHFDEDDIKLQW